VYIVILIVVEIALTLYELFSASSDRHSAPTRIRSAELADLDALVEIENRCFDSDRLSAAASATC